MLLKMLLLYEENLKILEELYKLTNNFLKKNLIALLLGVTIPSQTSDQRWKRGKTPITVSASKLQFSHFLP